jgi:hypothetical protein
VNSENDPDAVEMNEPYFYLIGLTLVDLEDLVADIKVILFFYFYRKLNVKSSIISCSDLHGAGKGIKQLGLLE